MFRRLIKSVDVDRCLFAQVFDKTVFVMKQPVVTEHALYSQPPNVESLRTALETKIKTKIQKWRSHMKTIWNR